MSLNQAVWAYVNAFAFGATCMGVLALFAPVAVPVAANVAAVVVLVTVARSLWSRRRR